MTRRVWWDAFRCHSVQTSLVCCSSDTDGDDRYTSPTGEVKNAWSLSSTHHMRFRAVIKGRKDIWNVPGSSLDPETGYPQNFRGIRQSLQADPNSFLNWVMDVSFRIFSNS